MNKEQWKNSHGFDDEEMDLIENGLIVVRGTISKVDKHTWKEEEIIIKNHNIKLFPVVVIKKKLLTY